MRLRIAFIGALSFLALLFGGCGRHEILVVDESGAPIADAEITGYSLSIQGQQAKTGQDGYAQIPSAAQPTQWIVVSKKGFVRTSQIDVSGPKPIKVVLKKK